MEIEGKKAVVVGGASGMAKASAELLAERGASVAILDLPTSAGAEVAARARRHVPPARRHRLRRRRDRHQRGGRGARAALHIAVNTAGGGIGMRTLTKEGPHPLDEFRRIDRAQPDRHVQPEPAAGRSTWRRTSPRTASGACIINTASIAAFEGQIGQVAYTAAKAGIAGMTLTMARDLGQPRHPGHVHRAEPVQHRHHRGHPRRVRGRAHQGRRLPEADGPARGVRPARRGHRREPDAERLVHPPRRRPALRPEVAPSGIADRGHHRYSTSWSSATRP